MDDMIFALKPTNEIGNILTDKVTDYENHLRITNKLSLMRKAYNQYYLADLLNGSLIRRGDQGQYLATYTNHYRSIIKAIIEITTAQKVAWKPKSTNTDYKSIAQTQLASSILDYFFVEEKFESFMKKAAEYGIVTSEGHILCEWDPTIGPEIAVNDDRTGTIKAGNIVLGTYNTCDVIRDYTKSSFSDCDWKIYRSYQNKYEVSSKYASFKDSIEVITLDTNEKMQRLGHDVTERNDDTICVYKFFHEKTTAVPSGRFVVFLRDGTVLQDGDLPYTKIPAYRIIHSDMLNTTFAHTIAFDLLPKQVEYDEMASIILTNNWTFGYQTIFAPTGSNVSSTVLADGMKLINYPAGQNPPTAVSLTATAPETYKRLQDIEIEMEKIAGIPGLLRGQVPPNINSGTGLAFLSSLSLQFNGDFQRNWITLNEEVGSSVVEILKTYADAPRMIPIVGKASAYKLKEFKQGELPLELKDINRVHVEVTNPLSKTPAGRLQIADNLLEKGLIKNPQDYITVMTTGNLDTLIEGTETDMNNIRMENEALMEGKQVVVLPFDNHPVHIDKHRCVLDDPDMRLNPEVRQAVLEHMLSHQAMWQQMTVDNPDLLAASNIPPAPTGGQKQSPPPTGAPMPAPEQGVQGPRPPAAPPNIPPELAGKFQETAGSDQFQNISNIPQVPAAGGPQ